MTLVCQYCRAQNDEEDHRCNRCGRRLAGVTPVQQGALAPALHPATASPPQAAPSGPQLVNELPKPAERLDRPIQASLFGPQEVLRKSAPVRAQTHPAPRLKRDRSAQQALDFNSAVPEGARTLPTSVEAAVYCHAAVAIPAHRALAAALDLAIVLIATGVFFGTLHFAGHQIVFSRQTLPAYTAAAIIIALFYRVLFCIANTDTLGTHWTGLRLLNFDGRQPDSGERLARTIGACVSVIAVGIGFAWALVDEERLTWHDYISKTFPSPRF
jgi:uncharacterized RDD family membrane protein YckC